MDRFSHPHAGLQDEQDDLRDSPGLSESVNCCMGHRRFMSKIGLGKHILRGSTYHAVHWDGYSILPDVIVIVLTCPGGQRYLLWRPCWSSIWWCKTRSPLAQLEWLNDTQHGYVLWFKSSIYKGGLIPLLWPRLHHRPMWFAWQQRQPRGTES